MSGLDIDLDALEAVAAALDLRAPNRDAVESIAFEIAQHYDVDHRTEPFEGVVDSATGVGKTYIFAAALEYLARARGARNFALIAPSRVILNKTLDQFTAGHAKSLLSEMTAPITVITAENFDSPAMAALMEDDSKVKLYVFTVQALLRPKKKTDRRTHTFQEGLGAGLYQRLQEAADLTVFADEHHAYYGPEFSAAIHDLHPWALIGLTATPHRRTPDADIIFRYPLAAAIADQYVKTPVIVGRRDDKHDPTTKLLDGVALLEYKREVAERYAATNGKPRVNPIMLVVARDINEANEWAEIVRSESFRGGAYRDAVLVVHSRAVKEDKEESALRTLTDVEHPDSPVRIVISVDMLKEGWDVKNVYALLSTKPMLSDILTEQVLGRGLRLPWGEYTGIEMLDTLEVLAHDKFEDLLKRKQVLNESFIDHRTRAVLRENAEGQIVVVRQTEQVQTPVIDLDTATDTDAAATPATPGQPALVDQQARQQVAKTEVERLAQDILPAQTIKVPLVRTTPIISQFSLTDITNHSAFRDLGRRLRANPDDTLRRTVVGARVVQDASGIRRTELIATTAADQVRTEGITLTLDVLRSQLTEAILSSPVVAARPDREDRERRAIEPILDAFFDGLDGGAEELLSAYLDRATAQLIALVNSEARKYTAKPNYEEVVTVRDFGPARTTAKPLTENRHGPFQRALAYQGWSERAIYPVAWFDSAPERDLANLLDDDRGIAGWLRLHVNELPIVWAADGRRYNPDFIAVDTDGTGWLIEVKADKDIDTADVQGKREAAQRWANLVNASDKTDRKWRYLLASESNIRDAKGSWEALKGLGQ
jgi:type III restriction enzyme